MVLVLVSTIILLILCDLDRAMASLRLMEALPGLVIAGRQPDTNNNKQTNNRLKVGRNKVDLNEVFWPRYVVFCFILMLDSRMSD